jgi:uncharacterized protein YdcH (DUF465 family)
MRQMLRQCNKDIYGPASPVGAADPTWVVGQAPAGGKSMLTETGIVERLRASSAEFRALEESHHRLDAELGELQKRQFLTPQEEMLKKQIQKEKLAKKDKMAELIRLYRENETRSAAR